MNPFDDKPKAMKNPNIFKTLKGNKCFMQQHMWKKEIWNIATIGFLSGASPRHKTKDVLQGKIDDNNDGPAYELGAANVNMYLNGQEYNTFAYKIKCPYEQMDAVCKHLANNGKKLDITLLKHKWKHTHPDVYINGMKKQNEHIHNI